MLKNPEKKGSELLHTNYVDRIGEKYVCKLRTDKMAADYVVGRAIFI